MNLRETPTLVLNGTEFKFDNTFVADGAVSADANGAGITVPESTTDMEIAIAFAFAKLNWVVIWCTADATLETNSSSAPDNTLPLYANTPMIWKKEGGTPYYANPFTANVTKAYLTCAAGGKFYFYGGVDVTP